MVKAKDTLISRFRKTDLSDYPSATSYDRDLDSALWVLWVHIEKLKQETYLTSSEIAEILRSYGVSIEEIEVTRAFAPAGKKIHRQDIGIKKGYKIMHDGIEYLRTKANASDVAVYHVQGNKPRSDHKMLKDLVKTSGEIRIVDPYYGVETLDILEQLDNNKPMKFLSENLSGNASRFSRELVTFKQQFSNIELRRYPTAHQLHDRYIITNEALILVGHGIKNLGGRESFVVVFSGDFGKEIRRQVSKTFNQRWASSMVIT